MLRLMIYGLNINSFFSELLDFAKVIWRDWRRRGWWCERLVAQAYQCSFHFLQPLQHISHHSLSSSSFDSSNLSNLTLRADEAYLSFGFLLEEDLRLLLIPLELGFATHKKRKKLLSIIIIFYYNCR